MFLSSLISYLFLDNFYYYFVLLKLGAQEEIDYSAKLKFSDDEGDDDGDEEEPESKNGILYVSEKY